MADDYKTYKQIRFANRIDNESSWEGSGSTLAKGELGIVIDKGYFFIGDGETTSRSFIRNKDSYPYNIYYAGSNSGGGGGSSSYTLPIASFAELGGVRATTNLGITINEYTGAISSDIISRYNDDKQCYEINHLYVRNLEYDNKETNSEFDGDNITLRASSTTALESPAGIIINNLPIPDTDNKFNGFLGLNSSNYITLRDSDGTYHSIVGINAYHLNYDDYARGIVTFTPGDTTAIIARSTPLLITNGVEEQLYYPEEQRDIKDGYITVDTSPVKLQVNGQSIALVDNTYNIVLDGGLTQETAAKLEQFDENIERIDILETQVITEVNATPNNIITAEMSEAQIGGRTITIEHLGSKPQPVSENSYSYVITSQDPEKLTFITGIECDDVGHITKIITKEISWSLQPAS